MTAVDSSNNRATCQISVIIDNEKPVLTCPDNIETQSTSVSYEASATDHTDLKITYNPPSGSTFIPGKTTIV